jgi:peptidoglycan/LPS O-acetylase OafA/YrhL
VTLEERLVATNFTGPGFDQIRLAAATVVLLYHSRAIEPGDIRVDPLFRYSDGFIQFGLLAVLVFFCISGFLVTPGLVRSGNVVAYLVHRVLRIFPALFVVVLASMLVLGPVLTTSSLASYFSDPGLYLYAKNALTLSIRYLPGVVSHDAQPIIVNGALWTLYFEVLSYLALALMSVLHLLNRRSSLLVVYLASYLIYAALNLEPANTALLSDRVVMFVSLFVYFAAGATFYVFRDRIPYSMALAVGAFAAVTVALPYGFGPILLPFCLPYIVIFCGLSVLPGQSLIKRDLSYGLYLIHAPILVALILLCPGLRTWWIGAAIVFIITMFLSYLSWTFVEAPMLRQKRELSSWISCKIGTLRAAWIKRREMRTAIFK